MGIYKNSQIFIKILQNFRFCWCEIRVFEVVHVDWKGKILETKKGYGNIDGALRIL